MIEDEKRLSPEFSFLRGIDQETVRMIELLVGQLRSSKDGGVGVLDRQTMNFMLFRTQAWQLLDDFLDPVFTSQPAIACFYDLLRTDDRRFIDDSVGQVLMFLKNQPSCQYRRYRLTLDLCLQNSRKQYIRLMVHIRFLPALQSGSSGLCVLRFYRINFECGYTKPLRSFCYNDIQKRVLFQTGEGSLPEFSQKRRMMLDLLNAGKCIKEIARIQHSADSTINNSLADFRGRLQLCNNTHLSHYDHCYAWQ